jgi:hypothetical protein
MATTTVVLAGAATAGDAMAIGPWPAPVDGDANPLWGTDQQFNGFGATADAGIKLWIPVGGAKRKVVTRTIGARQTLSGRLANKYTDTPIAGGWVTFARELNDRNGWKAVTRAQTDKKGRFRATMPGGPTRRFAVVYWPTIGSPGPVYSRRVQVRSAPKVWFTASSKSRGLVSFKGRVHGAAIPDGGLLVAIQVANRSNWTTVRLIRTDNAGRYSVRYRFAVRGRKFNVRLHVPRQSGWRLHTGDSKTLRVRSR